MITNGTQQIQSTCTTGSYRVTSHALPHHHLLELVDESLVLFQLGPVRADVQEQLVPVFRRHGAELRQDKPSDDFGVVHLLHSDVSDEIGQLRGRSQQPDWLTTAAK